MASKRHIRPFRTGLSNGQASVEYLLTLGGVFLALSGAAALLGSAFRRILGILTDLVRNAFYQ